MFKSESVKEIVETICINIEKSRVPLEGSILRVHLHQVTPPCSSLIALSRPGEAKMVRCEHSTLIVYCVSSVWPHRTNFLTSSMALWSL